MTAPFFFQFIPAYLKGAPSPIVVPLLLCTDVGGLDDQRAAAPFPLLCPVGAHNLVESVGLKRWLSKSSIFTVNTWNKWKGVESQSLTRNFSKIKK